MTDHEKLLIALLDENDDEYRAEISLFDVMKMLHELGASWREAKGSHQLSENTTRLVGMKKLIAVAALVLAGVAGSGCSIQIGTACYQVAGHPIVCSK